MKKLTTMALGAIMALFALSCSKTGNDTADRQLVSQDVLSQIYAMGLSTQDVVKVEGGYLVEGDIFIAEEDLGNIPQYRLLRIAEVEQYRTFNLVSFPQNGTRTITVSIKTSGGGKLPTSYIPAVDEAISRYNAENLKLQFTRVNSGGNIQIVKGNGNYLASAGFPSSSGNPYGQVKVNSNYIGSNPNVNYLATILAHEMGHCIGFRHTDYMDRSYSCGGSPVNEGASSVGAVHIPGTPTGPDSGSWMLSCIGNGQNRPFNNNDKTALDYLY